MNNYETVFILTPVLSDDQVKEAVEKFKSLLLEEGSEIVNEEDWGLRKLAYPIDKKTTGFYAFLEFKAEPHVIEKLEVNFRRDERVIRFLTVKQDKFALEYAEKRRNKGKKKQDTVTTNEPVKPKRVEKPEVKAEKPVANLEKTETKDENPEPEIEQVENQTIETVSPEVKDEIPEAKVQVTETKVENPEPEAEGSENVEEEVKLKEKED